MVANKKKHDIVPELDIDGVPLAQAYVIKVLGDMFNDKCNNKDLINDRIKRANACIVNSMSLCNELCLGRFSLLTLIVLYGAVFLSSVLFNAQAWSNIKKTEFERLQRVQLKFLKRSVKAPRSCPNAATFLEFGVLPIANEIHVRQLTFLHHILTLDSTDPVLLMFIQLKCFPGERNWANDVLELMELYGIQYDEEQISEMSKYSWKRLVKEKVQAVAFSNLIEECSSMKKTKHLKYESFGCQTYLTSMSPVDACVLFKARLNSVNCKGNMPSAFQDMTCRLCGDAVENQQHIVNCVHVRGEKTCLDVSEVYDPDADAGVLEELCLRLRHFEELRIKLT